ncbi:MAG: hypothetical protein RBR05_01900 [Candidatus Methanomethylophilaceae archaeon]|nr:hypothetical protein [Candidatus Methanomethylophilaceae archaeon]MDD3378578.1 hypothetical protein [Candidatus Methanomethylophilaceae archaeon]MDY0224137.1 hypothetical protein [Candidatus Methanomethylophilaceae archaeon]
MSSIKNEHAVYTNHMFNPEKDFNRKVIEILGKDGKSISSLAKDLETIGIKHHRLILTGYLRALTDMNILREREVPPSKIYIPIRSLPDSLYQSVEKTCKKYQADPNETTLYVLYKILKRPIFDSELKLAGVTRITGRPVDEATTLECKKVLRRSGNIIPGEIAYAPAIDHSEIYTDILTDIVLDLKDSKHLVMETKQTKLI